MKHSMSANNICGVYNMPTCRIRSFDLKLVNNQRCFIKRAPRCHIDKLVGHNLQNSLRIFSFQRKGGMHGLVLAHASNESPSPPQPRGSAMKVQCPSCRGKGHYSCVECDKQTPNPRCYTCGGWGVLLCPNCQGVGTLSMSTSSMSSTSPGPPRPARDSSLSSTSTSLTLGGYPHRQRRSPALSLESSWIAVPSELPSLKSQLKGSPSTRQIPRQAMTKLHKEKIRAAMKGRGRGVPKTEEHKQKIALAMKRSLSNSEHRDKIAASNRGRRKRCSICGQLGHNIRSCPQTGHRRPINATRLKRSTSKVVKVRKVRACSVCGKEDHDKRSCPENSQELIGMRRTVEL